MFYLQASMLMLPASLHAKPVLGVIMARPLALLLAAAATLANIKIPKHKPHAKTAWLVSTAMWLQPHVHHARKGSILQRVQAFARLVMQVKSRRRQARRSAQVALPALIAPR
jgi:hypothetical protein